ncbi:MAG: hypothetical protein HOJ88_00530 [Proteobacteria bacterium]|jgi:hypothetical protein|nr:hypothetical protein [Pseudomonadota bacterium]
MMINFLRAGSPFSILAILFLLQISSLSLAHHGWGGYNSDIDKNFVIAELRLGNAHDQLVATDDEGKAWDLVLATPARNRRLGFDENTLAVGDEINLLGRLHPSKSEIKVHCIYVAGETVYTYYDFDGTTSLSKHSDRDQC